MQPAANILYIAWPGGQYVKAFLTKISTGPIVFGQLNATNEDGKNKQTLTKKQVSIWLDQGTALADKGDKQKHRAHECH